VRYLTSVGLLAGAYFAAGSLGQVLAISPGNVTVVWPASGIALAVILLGGGRLWPGIWLGAFLVNVRTLFDPTLAPSLTASLAVGAAIATGSTVQALAGGRLVARLAGGSRFLDRARGVFLFAAGAAILCLIGSVVGASSLALGGFIPRTAYGFTWWTWWLGDVTGVIVIAPLILAWSRHPRATAAAGGRVEAAAFLVLLLAAGQLIFGGWPLGAKSGAATTYLAFPLLTWAAFRFGQRGATTAVLIMTVMAILGAARGSGPFQDVAVQQSLWVLQAYGGVLALSTLALAAVLAERHTMEESLNECNRGLERRVAERSAVAEQRAQGLARSEESHKEQARTLRSILDNILEGVVVADPIAANFREFG
jgi:integral membrane sensor domain MASE1